MTVRRCTFLVLLPLLFLGCKSATPGAAAGAQTPSTAHSVNSSIPTATGHAEIHDDTFDNMTAMTTSIPAGWRFDGILLGTPCTTQRWPVFRAYAADGLTELRGQPVFGWRWSTHPPPPGVSNKDCLPLTGQMTAARFLDYYITTIPGGLHVVGPMPVSDAFKATNQKFADFLNANNSHLMPALQANHTSDVAAIRVLTNNGSFVIEQRIRAIVQCAVRSNPGIFQGGDCFVRVDVARTPQGKLDALVDFLDSHHLPSFVPTNEWMAAMNQRQQQEASDRMHQLTERERQQSAMLLHQHEQIMASMQANHEAFMAQQESSFRSSMNAAFNSMNARTTAASDWVDYALDQQTVVGQGGFAKVSNSYNHTWSSTVGGQTTWYQTDDPNTNPNGYLPGNWTQDVKVHGNGQPY